MTHYNLNGRVALTTGSGRNIGKSTAIALAELGAAVVVNGHKDQSAVNAVVDEINAKGGRAIGIMADISRDDEAERLVAHTVDQLGGVDVLVSNVGIRPYQAFLKIAPEDWDNVLRTNLTAAFYLSRHAIPHMQKNRWGRIIFVSGFDGFWGQSRTAPPTSRQRPACMASRRRLRVNSGLTA